MVLLRFLKKSTWTVGFVNPAAIAHLDLVLCSAVGLQGRALHHVTVWHIQRSH